MPFQGNYGSNVPHQGANEDLTQTTPRKPLWRHRNALRITTPSPVEKMLAEVLTRKIPVRCYGLNICEIYALSCFHFFSMQFQSRVLICHLVPGVFGEAFPCNSFAKGATKIPFTQNDTTKLHSQFIRK